ncbi:MAG: OmpH family outer membrane protein [Planctomycetota bacterium]
MTKNRPLIAVSLLAALLAAVLVGRESVAQNAAQPSTAVAIVDLPRVFRENQFVQNINTRLAGREQELGAALKARQDQIRALGSSLEMLAVGSDEYKAKRSEFIKAQVDLQAWQNFEQVQIQNEQRELLAQVQGKIEEAIAEVARARGVQVVLSSDPSLPENLGQLSPQQLQQFVLSMRMPYHDTTLDISADVIARIDANFQAAE